MRFTTLATAALAVACCVSASHAAEVTITSLDVRGTGIFGHPDVSGVTINGVAPPNNVTADPLNITLTYSNLDLDGDSTANDSVTFTLTAAGGGANQRAWGQGIDTGFGNLNDVTVSVTNVSGTTTDSGNPILFDGFTGADIGVGGNGDLDRSAEINGQAVSISSANTNAFQFLTAGVDFAPTPTVLFDNSGGTFGSVVARTYDLQFSAIPEPSAALLLGLAVSGVVARRRSLAATR
ncbi:MAG: PEP-CTERM sorting domain-containing protein [Planctomycetota bacterium]